MVIYATERTETHFGGDGFSACDDDDSPAHAVVVGAGGHSALGDDDDKALPTSVPPPIIAGPGGKRKTVACPTSTARASLQCGSANTRGSSPRKTAGTASSQGFFWRQLIMCEGILSGAADNHVAVASPRGQWPATAGAPTSEKPAEASGDAGDKLKQSLEDTIGKMEPDACFPACMNDSDGNVKEVRVVDPQAKTSVELETKNSAGMGDADTPPTTTSSGRRSRRNSRRMSSDNQYEGLLSAGGPNFDLEDVAKGVLSPVDYHSRPKPPGSIVVDYDEGMPERSRTGLLKEVSVDSGEKPSADGPPSGDCAPEACNPLDALAFEELAIEDTRIPRPRLGSSSQPKTPSRRGKSVVLSSAAEAPVAVSKTIADVKEKKKQEPDEVLERCSTMHKLCLCEVRLHKSRESCWLVANNSVYDVTGLVDSHPAGPRSIMRKAGGADCTKDMKFHSKAARKMLEKCFIGKLVPCGEDPAEADGPAACTIM